MLPNFWLQHVTSCLLNTALNSLKNSFICVNILHLRVGLQTVSTSTNKNPNWYSLDLTCCNYHTPYNVKLPEQHSCTPGWPHSHNLGPHQPALPHLPPTKIRSYRFKLMNTFVTIVLAANQWEWGLPEWRETTRGLRYSCSHFPVVEGREFDVD
jgi:hypothetical protein